MRRCDVRGLGIDWYRRPELVLADVLLRAARGDDLVQRTYHRATVLAVDPIGGLLQNPDGSGGMDVIDRTGRSRHFNAISGPPNPRWALKARIVTDGFDRMLSDDEVRVFWPILPPDQLGLTIAPGEHVYVLFEASGTDHGLWLGRVSGQDSANSFQGSDSYTTPSAPQTGMDAFAPNDPEYDRSDEAAGLAPIPSGMAFFGGD